MASQTTGVSIVYSSVGSGSDQRKHQSTASLAFVRGIHRWPVNSTHKGPVTRKMFPFDDVIMTSPWNQRHICNLIYHMLTHKQLDDWDIRTQHCGYKSPGANAPGGRFKNTYELLNLRALKISKLHKNYIFQCMGKIFCVEFQRVPLKFHTKYLTHTLKDVDFIHIWKFKNS